MIFNNRRAMTMKNCLQYIMFIHVVREVKDEAIGLACITANQ